MGRETTRLWQMAQEEHDAASQALSMPGVPLQGLAASQTMAASISVRQHKRVLFQSSATYNQGRHAEVELLMQLDRRFPNKRLPDHAQVTVFCHYSPCRRCLERYGEYFLFGNQRLTPQYRTSFLDNSPGARLKITWSVHYVGGSRSGAWGSEEEMWDAYNWLSQQAGGVQFHNKLVQGPATHVLNPYGQPLYNQYGQAVLQPGPPIPQLKNVARISFRGGPA